MAKYCNYLEGVEYNTIEMSTCIAICAYHTALNFAVGTAEASISSDGNYYFNRLFVKSQYRKKGVGTKLLETLLSKIKENGLVLQLDINAYGDMSHEALENFYIKHGFIKERIENGVFKYDTYYFNKKENVVE